MALSYSIGTHVGGFVHGGGAGGGGGASGDAKKKKKRKGKKGKRGAGDKGAGEGAGEGASVVSDDTLSFCVSCMFLLLFGMLGGRGVKHELDVSFAHATALTCILY